MEGNDTIKLKNDASGQHHYIPVSWVKAVDDKIHVDRPGEQAMREWTTSPTDEPTRDATRNAPRNETVDSEDSYPNRSDTDPDHPAQVTANQNSSIDQ